MAGKSSRRGDREVIQRKDCNWEAAETRNREKATEKQDKERQTDGIAFQRECERERERNRERVRRKTRVAQADSSRVDVAAAFIHPSLAFRWQQNKRASRGITCIACVSRCVPCFDLQFLSRYPFSSRYICLLIHSIPSMCLSPFHPSDVCLC